MSGKIKKQIFKRKFISLDTKIEILNRKQSGEKNATIAKSLNLNESTIRTILKNESQIRQNVAGGCSQGAKRVSRKRDINVVKMEHSLMIWFEDCLAKRIPLSTKIIKQKAVRLYTYLKESELSSENQAESSFLASNGWFENFKKRFSLRNVKFQGEQATANTDGAEKFKVELQHIIETGAYSPDQIFNADETALYWKQLPSRTFIAKGQNTAPGFKVCKDRVTLHMCSNLSGDFVMKPMIINRTENPRAMKNIDKTLLPVFWRANAKGWMTKSLYEDWFKNCFLPQVDQYLKQKNLSFKILLIVDNASSHTKELDHPNVKIVFLPPNCTSLIQPLDQGIISTLKAYYIRLSFEKIFNRLESDGNATILQTWKEFSILDCVTTVALACKELKRNTLNRCWKSLLPQMVNTENVGSTLEDEYNRIISVASNLEGDGFVDMNIQDIRELFEEKTLDEEELIALLNISNFDQNENFSFIAPKLSLADVQKGIALANDLENHFVDKDSSAVRCGKFKRDLRSCLGPYREVLAQLQSDFVAASSDEEITSDEDFQANMKKINTKSRVIFDDSDDSN